MLLVSIQSASLKALAIPNTQSCTRVTYASALRWSVVPTTMSKAASKALKQAVMSELMELQSLPAVSMEELAKHNTAEDAWVMVDGVVYNVTKFAKLHPGGRAVLLRAAGTDATVDFKQVHADSVLKRYANLRVGRLAVEELDPAEAKKLFTKKAEEKWLPLSDAYFNDIRGTLKSPNFQQKHIDYAMKVRAFCEKEIIPNIHKWEEAKKYPRELHKKAYDAGCTRPPCRPSMVAGLPRAAGIFSWACSGRTKSLASAAVVSSWGCTAGRSACRL
jgi:cytochrome b involved in lipid metabolism